MYFILEWKNHDQRGPRSAFLPEDYRFLTYKQCSFSVREERPGKEGHWLSLVTLLLLSWCFEYRKLKDVNLCPDLKELLYERKRSWHVCMEMVVMVATYCTCVLVRTVSLLVVLCLANETPHGSVTSSTSRVTAISGLTLVKSHSEPRRRWPS